MGQARDVTEGWFKDVPTGDVKRWLHPDVVFETPVTPAMRDHTDIIGFVASYKDGFPDSGFTLDNVWEVGDTAITEGHYTGTNTGPMQTPDGQQMPATGKTVNLPFVSIIQAKDGKMISHRVYWDQAGFAAQLGMAPK
ncbi:MAG: ester cyclase [Actinomycetota bacterium]